jgi:type I restriction enzyme, S subunit
MVDEWHTATVSELQSQKVLLVEDGNHGEYRPRADEFVDEGVAFIRAADMDDGRILFESASKINERARQRITKGIGAPGDVLISHKGTVGKIALAPIDAPPFVCSPQTTFWRALDLSRLDRGYLYAFLRSVGFHNQLATRAGETDMAPYVSLTSQRDLSVTLPPIETQRAIAKVLNPLDNKIELNWRMNETLEAMTRALFKSWFVDFDPVRVKVEDRDPGLSKKVADLFPEFLTTSQIGGVPEGWRLCRWGDLVSLEYGKSLSNYTGNNNAFPVFGTNGKIGTYSHALCNHPGIVVGRKGAYRGIHFSNTPFFVIDTAFYVKPKEPMELRWAYYELLRHDINGMDSGSAIPSTSREDFYSLPVLAPPLHVQQAFVEILSPCWARQEKNAEESRTLADMRDALLPKLISGELRFKDVEKCVGPRQ